MAEVANAEVLQFLKTFYHDMMGFKKEALQRLDRVEGSVEKLTTRVDNIEGKIDLLTQAVTKNSYDLKELNEKCNWEFREIREMIRDDQKKIQEVYDTRRELTVRFTRAWGFAAFAAGIVGSFSTYIMLR